MKKIEVANDVTPIRFLEKGVSSIIECKWFKDHDEWDDAFWVSGVSCDFLSTVHVENLIKPSTIQYKDWLYITVSTVGGKRLVKLFMCNDATNSVNRILEG